MLKVNVGMSRKVSKDYNSTGFSVNLEGEICVPLDDPEGVVEKIKELYDVAEEALAQQLERHESDSAIASRDEPRQQTIPARTPAENRNGGNGFRGESHTSGNGHERPEQSGEPATNKQVQFLLSLGKRLGMTPPQLGKRIAGILGREIGLYDLSKQEAGIVLDRLTADFPTGTPSRRRS